MGSVDRAQSCIIELSAIKHIEIEKTLQGITNGNKKNHIK